MNDREGVNDKILSTIVFLSFFWLTIDLPAVAGASLYDDQTQPIAAANDPPRLSLPGY